MLQNRSSPIRLSYRITTLGCRVNHAETREIESVLLARGLEPAPRGAPANLEVIHTCTVTSSAAAKSRHEIRRARRRQAGAVWPDAHKIHEVIVTGCFATSDSAEAARLAGNPDRLLQHEAPDEAQSPLTDRLAQRVDHWLAGHRSLPSLRSSKAGSCPQKVLPLPLVRPERGHRGHVRAELKIQDGCDARCSFCIIPQIRRTLRSKRVGDAVEEARRLVELGHREIVLTGIFIGAYGHETALRRRQTRPGGAALAELVDAVARVPGLARLRVSSMEPGDVSDALLDAMVANRPTVVPHLHLPLQSGSDAILRRMNRQYRVGDYLEMIDRIHEALTDEGLPPAVTTDVICGFPGETEADFERTVQVAHRVGYLHMHVFPFSPRQGTAAARWRSAFVAPAVAGARVRTLIDLENDPHDGLSMRYRRRLIGRRLRVIAEQPDRLEPTMMTGRCDHYAKVWFETDRPRGTVCNVTITSVTTQRTTGADAMATISLPVTPTVTPLTQPATAP